MKVATRSARSEDARRLAEIWIDVSEYYAALDPEAFRVPARDGLVEWIEDSLREPSASDELNLVAEVDEKVVGFLEGAIEEPIPDSERQFVREPGLRRLVVSALAVERARWREGIGSELMAAAERWGRESGAVISCLDTYIDSPVSVSFYERRLGYARRSINFRKPL